IWSLLNPGVGTSNIVVNFSGAASGGAVVGGTTFTNVDQASPLGTFVGTHGNSTTRNATVFSAAGELVFDTVAWASATALSPGPNQTQGWNLQPVIRGAGSTDVGSNSVTMSWTSATGTRWA